VYDVEAWATSCVHLKLYPAALFLVVVMRLPLFYMGFIGPIVTVPWQNRFKFVCINCLGMILIQLSGVAAGTPGEHPVEPRTSIIPSVSRAIVQGLRIVDSMTDLSLITELLAEVPLHLFMQLLCCHAVSPMQPLTYHHSCPVVLRL
jgi:uncharacterized membrane protein YjjP (DUF1212 family)